jgi:drug/metabolite transporter (DMT)-like permease
MSVPAAAAPMRGGLMPLAVGWAAALLWGGSPIATRLAVLGMDPLAVGILRTVLAAAIALPLALMLRLKLPRRERLGADARGCRGQLRVVSDFVFPGVKHTTASHAALVHASTPLFTGIIAAGLERRWPGRWWWIGVAVALFGEALLIGLGRGFNEPGVTVHGDLVVFAACLAVAFGYVAGGSLTQSLGSLSVTFWGVVLAALASLPGLLLIPGSGLQAAPPAALGGLAYLVLISSVVGYIAWNWALAHGGIGRTGVLQFAQPVLIVLLAMLLLGEALTPSVIVSSAVILAGVAIARRS